MRLRRPAFQPLHTLLLLCLLHFVHAQDEGSNFDCHLAVDSLKYDLTALAGEHTISRTRETPPSTMVDSLRFDLCAELKALEGVKEADQCQPGTRACLTKTNKKGEDPDRIVAVIPIAQTSNLKPQFSSLSSPQGVSLILHGSTYPTVGSHELEPQSLNLTLLCSSSDASTEPIFKDYDGKQVQIEWSVPAGCGFTGDDSGKGDDGNGDGELEHVGSGIGWFFLVLLLAFVAYFGLGAYYNYSTYGASGADLIPHRDFWREVPYMLKDVLSHLCSTVRPRHTSSRGGYIAV